MSAALLYGVGSVGQEPSGSIRKSYKRGEAAAQRPRSLLFLTGATLGLRVWPQLLRISAHHSARFWYFDHSNQPLQPGSQLLVGVQRSRADVRGNRRSTATAGARAKTGVVQNASFANTQPHLCVLAALN